MDVAGQMTDDDLLGLSDDDFVSVWTAAFGEPPAAVIDRIAMIDIMFQSTNTAIRAASDLVRGGEAH